MKVYLELLEKIINEGEDTKVRTGGNAKTLLGVTIRHKLRDAKGRSSFPLLTTKKVNMKNVAVELEGFIKAITDKKWYQDRGCHIWDYWCNPRHIKAYKAGAKRDELQQEIPDLGPIYGSQWRNFGFNSKNLTEDKKLQKDYNKKLRYDQLKKIITELKSNKYSRRLLVSAWNPLEKDEMALPPCHFAFQVRCINKKLSLIWFQRSCDVPIGLPYNLASYSLLLELISRECKLVPDEIIGMISDAHIYQNQFNLARDQLLRIPYKSPQLKIKKFKSIFNWEYQDIDLKNYKNHSFIKYPINI